MKLHHSFSVFWLNSTSLVLLPEEATRNTAEKPNAKYSSIPAALCLTCLSTYLKEQQTYHTF